MQKRSKRCKNDLDHAKTIKTIGKRSKTMLNNEPKTNQTRTKIMQKRTSYNAIFRSLFPFFFTF